MRELAGKVVVVTGAASGIGAALAAEFAGAGSELALADLDEVGVRKTARSVARPDRLGLAERIDVADEAVMRGFADAVVDHFGRVDVVVNNAGIGADSARVDQLAPADYREIMDVNFFGVVNGTTAFLPHLLTRPEAAIVNLSSIFGIVGVPLLSPYCASKFAVRGFTDSLRAELAVVAPHVTPVLVHPGGVASNIADSARRLGTRPSEQQQHDREHFATALRIPPSVAAAKIRRAVERRQPRVRIGADAHLLDVVARLAPTAYSRVVTRTLQRSGVTIGDLVEETGDLSAPAVR